MIREMQKCLLTTITAASMLAIATPARAQTLMEIGPEVNYADKCFSRSYSAQHLNAKSRQLVTRIALAALNRGVEGPQLFPNESEFLIAVQTRLGRGWHSRIAICSVGSSDMMNSTARLFAKHGYFRCDAAACPRCNICTLVVAFSASKAA